MVSRLRVGAAVLAAVWMVIGVGAAAQQGGRFHDMLEHTRERRLREADPGMTPIPGPGDYRFSFIHGGLRRDYLVHVPQGYRGLPMPMLIALHGGGGDADFQADDSRYHLISKSDEAGFIAVFPNGYSAMPGGILATWNAGTCCGPAMKHNIDDVGFIREIIRRMRVQARIDPNRIFATGMSNGAMMSWRLACEASEIRAIAPIAGTDNTPACRPSRSVPVIEFHALNDDHVPFGGGRGDLSIARTDFVSVPATQAKWIRIDRAAPAAQRVLSVPGARCDLHVPAPGGAPVELCTTTTGGHSWPGGGTQQGRKQPSMAISANDLMWQFFSSLK